MTYDLLTQVQVGQVGEQILDRAISGLWTLLPATFAQQHCGIDRVAILSNGRPLYLEYKLDRWADKTGNAFIETSSSDSKPGWAVASRAHLLIYLLADSLRVYLIPVQALKRQVPRWQQLYPKRGAPNPKYTTEGLLVPLWELAAIGEVSQLRS